MGDEGAVEVETLQVLLSGAGPARAEAGEVGGRGERDGSVRLRGMRRHRLPHSSSGEGRPLPRHTGTAEEEQGKTLAPQETASMQPGRTHVRRGIQAGSGRMPSTQASSLI